MSCFVIDSQLVSCSFGCCCRVIELCKVEVIFCCSIVTTSSTMISTATFYHHSLLLGLLLLGTAIFTLTEGANGNGSALEPEDYLRRANEQLQRQIQLLTTAQWNLASNITSENEAKVVSTSEALKMFLEAINFSSIWISLKNHQITKCFADRARQTVRRLPQGTVRGDCRRLRLYTFS